MTAAIVLLATVYVVAWFAPAVGLYHDDGIYLVTAKALAEGKGYRIISLPHELDQTKYPFLFPAALSVAWRAWPAFPRNVQFLKAVPLLFALIWFVLGYRLLARLGARRAEAVWVMLLTAASPMVIYVSTSLLSESMFSAFFTAALLCALSAERSDDDRMALAAGALAALAFLTRTAGLAPLIAIPAAFLFRRRYGAAWRALAAGASLAGMWPLWVRLHAATPPASGYYSAANYAGWNIVTSFGMAEKLRVLYSNFMLSLATPGLLVGLPGSMWLLVGTLLLVLVLPVKRLVRLDGASIPVLAYIGLVLCWAWPPTRFFVPVLPIVLFWIWKSLAAVTAGPRLRYAGMAAAILVSVVLLTTVVRSIPRTLVAGQFTTSDESAQDWTELQKTFTWLRTHTATGDVVVANLDPAVFLYSGRKATRSFAGNSYKLFYAENAPTADASEPLEKILADAGASWLVVAPERGFAEAPVIRLGVAKYLERHPGALELAARPDAAPEYLVYRVRR